MDFRFAPFFLWISWVSLFRGGFHLVYTRSCPVLSSTTWDNSNSDWALELIQNQKMCVDTCCCVVLRLTSSPYSVHTSLSPPPLSSSLLTSCQVNVRVFQRAVKIIIKIWFIIMVGFPTLNSRIKPKSINCWCWKPLFTIEEKYQTNSIETMDRTNIPFVVGDGWPWF